MSGNKRLVMVQLYHGDCLVEMQKIADKSVDMILCDLPYGTTACKWDCVIPFDSLWGNYRRLIKPTGAIVLFGQQPFTSALIMSNIAEYKYSWIWQKDSGTNFLNAHHQPLKTTEEICVFGQYATTESRRGLYLNYNPQMRKGFKPYTCKSGAQRKDTAMVRGVCKAQNGGAFTASDGDRFPVNIIQFKRDKERFHPTQKPVALLEYLIKTYTNEGDTVLDNTMGSGSTGVACVNTGRDFIGIELNEEYFKIAFDRIKKAEKEKSEMLF